MILFLMLPGPLSTRSCVVSLALRRLTRAHHTAVCCCPIPTDAADAAVPEWFLPRLTLLVERFAVAVKAARVCQVWLESTVGDCRLRWRHICELLAEEEPCRFLLGLS
jgi:hypothetical protein